MVLPSPNRSINAAIAGGLILALLAGAGGVTAQVADPAGAPTEKAAPKLNLIKELNQDFFGNSLEADGKHIRLSGSFTTTKGQRRGFLTLSAQIDPGWHVFSLDQPKGGSQASEIKVAPSKDFKVLGRFQPDRPPHIKPPDVFPVPSEEHEVEVNWSAPIELSEGVDPESLSIKLTFNGQVCSTVCIPLFDETVTASFAGYTSAPAQPGEFRPDKSEAQLVLKGHVEPAVVGPGGKAKLTITAEPNSGWHVYAYAAKDPNEVGANKPTLIYLAPVSGWDRSAVKASVEPKTKPPLAKGLPSEKSYDEPVSWTIELTAPANVQPGETVLSGYLGFQTCDDKRCLPPQAVQFRASLPVKESTQAGRVSLEFAPLKTAEGKSAGISSYNDVAKLVAENPAATAASSKHGLLTIIGFGLVGGLILNFMPCVWPVIGLKLFSFVQQGGHSRAKIFSLNVWFVLGLLAVFMALATLAAFGSLIPHLNQNLSWGQQFTFTWFKVAMVVIVFAFALSFLGVWEVPIPGFAESSTSSKLQHQEGPAGAFFKGIFTTLLATPCSGPLLGSVFAYTLAQPPLITYVIFGSVGLGMASPYLAIGAFPGLIRWLPKPGQWMEWLKQSMGFVLLFTVVYLFSTINKDYFIPTLTLVIGVWIACWIIGRVPVYESLDRQLQAWLIGCVSAGVIGWFAFTFLGPYQHLYEWKSYSPEAVAKLRGEGKTVMVDFTANWCQSCQFNFITAINTQRVKTLVEKNGVVPLIADWSDRNEMIKQSLHELKSDSIPLLVIYPAGKPSDVIVLRDVLLEKQVLAALEQAGPSEKHKTATATTAIADKHQVTRTKPETDAND